VRDPRGDACWCCVAQVEQLCTGFHEKHDMAFLPAIHSDPDFSLEDVTGDHGSVVQPALEQNHLIVSCQDLCNHCPGQQSIFSSIVRIVVWSLSYLSPKT
jgi:hypothetical protein